jgi:hypothetical protein
MTTPEERAADGRPLGKVEPTTRRPQSAGGAESGRSVSGAHGGERPCVLADRVLPRARGPLPDRATDPFPTVVLTVVSASRVSVGDPC